MSLPVWLWPWAQGVMLTLHIQPGARETSVVGVHGEALKIRLAAPPVEGRANAALIACITDWLGPSRVSVTLARGASACHKQLLVAGLSAEVVVERLAARQAVVPGKE